LQVNNKLIKIIQLLIRNLKTLCSHLKTVMMNGKVKAKERIILLWKIKLSRLGVSWLSFSEEVEIHQLKTNLWLLKVKSTRFLIKELYEVLLKDLCKVMPREREAPQKKLLKKRSLNWLKKRWKLNGKFSSQGTRTFS